MDLSSFPKHFWPVIATPVAPNRIALRFVMHKEDYPSVTEGLIFNYEPDRGQAGSILPSSSSFLVRELMEALGYDRLPSGSIEGVCHVLSSQMFPSLEQIEKHPHNPVSCSIEHYTTMSRMFFNRQFNEQSRAELDYWRARAEQVVSMKDDKNPNKAVYAGLIPNYYDRTLAVIESQKAYLPELWDRLVAHFKDVGVVSPMPYVGLRIKCMDKSPFADRK
jgi:hypothetical protein